MASPIMDSYDSSPAFVRWSGVRRKYRSVWVEYLRFLSALGVGTVLVIGATHASELRDAKTLLAFIFLGALVAASMTSAALIAHRSVTVVTDFESAVIITSNRYVLVMRISDFLDRLTPSIGGYNIRGYEQVGVVPNRVSAALMRAFSRRKGNA